MSRIRNLFLPLAVCCVGVTAATVWPFSAAGAAGVAGGGMVAALLTASQVRGIHLAQNHANGLKWSLYILGVTRLAAYAGVFYIAVRFSQAPVASVVGSAGGLLIPLAVMVFLASTDTDLRESAD